MGTATSGVRRRHLAASSHGARRRTASGMVARVRAGVRAVGRSLPSGTAEWLHRAVNLMLAALALAATLPVLLLLAVLIKLTSRGPVFYLQERVGLDRRLPDPGPVNHRRTHDLGGRVVHDLQVPHDAGRRRSRRRGRLGPGAGPARHPAGPGAAPVPAGRAAPAAQRAQGRDEHRRPPARAAHDLRRAPRATSPSTRCASGPSPASPAWRRSTTTTTARSTTCAPR